MLFLEDFDQAKIIKNHSKLRPDASRLRHCPDSIKNSGFKVRDRVVNINKVKIVAPDASCEVKNPV
jgi:hypothetical protein